MSLPVNRIPLVLGSASGGGSSNTDDLVESITYDGTNKKLIVTKDDGDTSDVPISDLSAIATNTNTINNLYSDIQPHSNDDSILQVKKVNQNTFTDIQMRDAYSKTQSDGKYYVIFFDIFFISWSKRGDGFHIGFQKNGKCIFYGSSVRMGHKVYIFPILLPENRGSRN